jgi:hypothetical protein
VTWRFFVARGEFVVDFGDRTVEIEGCWMVWNWFLGVEMILEDSREIWECSEFVVLISLESELHVHLPSRSVDCRLFETICLRVSSDLKLLSKEC